MGQHGDPVERFRALAVEHADTDPRMSEFMTLIAETYEQNRVEMDRLVKYDSDHDFYD